MTIAGARVDRKIRVLIVDDSAVVRQLFRRELEADPDIEVVGTAPDPYVARDMIVQLQPDVLTLDLEMPRLDGLSFLRKLMHFSPMPVVVVSSLTAANSATALESLRCGAVEVLHKGGQAHAADGLESELVRTVKAAAKARVNQRIDFARSSAPRATPLSNTTNKFVAMGASTGGTQALEYVLRSLPVETPGIVIVQHMPEKFTRSFAQRLDEICTIKVKEAENGDAIVPGVALIAPGNVHLTVKRSGARMIAKLQDGPRVSRHRPSVDVLFESVAKEMSRNAVGVIMTGMGSDGARGMAAMRAAGAWNIAQDEESCVVFGMPKVAIEMGGVDEVTSLESIPARLLEALEKRKTDVRAA